MDFAVLPPEVNSARMYAGAGSGSLVAAAAAWDRLAGSLASAEQSCRVVLEELTDGSWRGSSAAAMTGAARPYLAWLSGTAVQAAQTAEQARGAVAAYEAAFSATVPPAVIGANRSALAVLVRTNVFGQNTAAIAANQAEYAQMWAQDAAAMHSYAASAAAVAPQPGAFTAPPQTTNPSAAGSQTATTTQALTQAASTSLLKFLDSPQMTSNSLTNFLDSPFIQGFEQFTNEVSGLNGFMGGQGFLVDGVGIGGYDFPVQGAIAAMYLWTALNPSSVGLAATVTGDGAPLTLAGSQTLVPAADAISPGGGVTAGLGRATPLGGLSVPPSWGALPQGVRLASASLATMGMAGLPEATMAGPGSWFGGVPPMGGVVNAPRNDQPAAQLGAASTGAAPAAGAAGANKDVASAGASSQREELNRLRHTVAEMTLQRDTLKRSAAAVINRVRRR